MAERLRSLNSNHLHLKTVGSNPARDFELFYLKKLTSSSLQNVGGSSPSQYIHKRNSWLFMFIVDYLNARKDKKVEYK